MLSFLCLYAAHVEASSYALLLSCVGNCADSGGTVSGLRQQRRRRSHHMDGYLPHTLRIYLSGVQTRANRRQPIRSPPHPSVRTTCLCMYVCSILGEGSRMDTSLGAEFLVRGKRQKALGHACRVPRGTGVVVYRKKRFISNPPPARRCNPETGDPRSPS